MKKSLLTASLIAGFGVVAIAPTVSAADGLITINGQITSATCTVAINGGTASPTIVLPTVQATDFTASGTATGFTAMTIALSGCSAGSGTPAVTKVLPYFEQGPNTDLSTGYLKNAAATTPATGVEVLLSSTNATSGKLNLAAGSGSQGAGTAALISGNPSFTYYVAYVSTAASVTAGSVSTTVQYDLNYQ